jgi:hypothetical protein
VRNRGIGRARLFMGALLLLATVLTWATGLMMSPHSETVVKGTEHLRTTIVTFKRNGAIGTLILCALSAWLLFPRRRPRWPERDWALIALISLLGGTSIYTLIWLPASASHTPDNENLATTNIDWNVSERGSDLEAVSMNATPAPHSNQLAVRHALTAAAPEANDRMGLQAQAPTTKANVTEEQVEANVADERADADSNGASPIDPDEPENDAPRENQE